METNVSLTKRPAWLLRLFRTGVCKLRPAGQIRSAKPFHPAAKTLRQQWTNNKFTKQFSWFRRIWHIPKQWYYVRCPDLELLCDGLCGPLARNVWICSIHKIGFRLLLMASLDIPSVSVPNFLGVWWKLWSLLSTLTKGFKTFASYLKRYMFNTFPVASPMHLCARNWIVEAESSEQSEVCCSSEVVAFLLVIIWDRSCGKV